MKNTIKISLVTAVAVVGLTTTSSASTLAEAFAASTVKGEIKSQFFQHKDTKINGGVSSNVLNTGGNLSLKTGSFNGVTGGVTFQTAHVINNNDKTRGYYSGNQNVSGSVMSESYLAYTMANTTAKMGRQYVSTPLVAGSGSRILKQSWEGYVLANTDISNTTLFVAYLSKFQGRTNGIGGVSAFNNYGQGLSTYYVKNTSVANLTVKAQYAVKKLATANDEKITFAEGTYKLNPATISAQAYKSDVAAKNGTFYAVKVAGKVGMVSLMGAYSTTSNQAVSPGFGSGADNSYTGGTFVGSGPSMKANSNSYKVSIGTKVMGLGLNLAHANSDVKAANNQFSETNLTAKYAFNKELSTAVRYSSYGGNYNQDYRSRVYLSYKF